MHLNTAFCTDYTAYTYGRGYLLLANLPCKLSLVSDDFSEADSTQKSIRVFRLSLVSS